MAAECAATAPLREVSRAQKIVTGIPMHRNQRNKLPTPASDSGTGQVRFACT
jgi:hypothetical protein